jgi:hypothetical protein
VTTVKLKYYDPKLKLSEWDDYARAHPRDLYILAEDLPDHFLSFGMTLSSGERRSLYAMLRWAIHAYNINCLKLDPGGYLMVLPPAVAGQAAEWWKPNMTAVNQVFLYYGLKDFPGPLALRAHEFNFLCSQHANRPDKAFAGILKVDRGLAPKKKKWKYYPLTGDEE